MVQSPLPSPAPAQSPSSPQLRVLVFGATSRVGPGIIASLLTSSSIETTLVLRPSSSSPPSYPSPGPKHLVLPSDSPTFSELVDSFRAREGGGGYDVLVSALGRQTFPLQRELADVCVAAGIRRYVLADYGSVSSADPVALDYLALYREKKRVREYAESVARKNEGKFSWSSLVTGHFFDYGLRTDLLGLSVEKGQVRLFDGGKTMWSSSTLPQIGRATLAILNNEEATANKLLYVQSFRHSQLEVVAAVEKVIGKKLARKQVSSEAWLAERKSKAKEGDADAVEEVVQVLGIMRSDWTGQEGYANDLLGLKEESLEEVVRGVLGKVEKDGGGWCVIG